jgi:hypothetical protein
MISVGAAANMPRMPGPYGQYVLLTRDAKGRSHYNAGRHFKNSRGRYVCLPRACVTLKIFRGRYVLLPRACMSENIPRRVCPTTTSSSCTKPEVSSLRQDESSKRGDGSQQIATWQLLYRVHTCNQKQGSSADGHTVAAEAGRVPGGTYRTAITVTEPTPSKGTEERPDQRPCLSARHHSD